MKPPTDETDPGREGKPPAVVRPIPTYREIRRKAGAEEECSLCGLCCEACGGDLLASRADVLAWLSAGQTGILRHVRYETHPDGRLRSFDPMIWSDPDSPFDQQMSRCPFLQISWEEGFRCRIYDQRPETCREFETGGPRCQQLREKRLPRPVPGR